MLNSVSSADLYECRSDDNCDSHLEVDDPLVLPEGIYIVNRLISTRKVKVCWIKFYVPVHYESQLNENRVVSSTLFYGKDMEMMRLHGLMKTTSPKLQSGM